MSIIWAAVAAACLTLAAVYFMVWCTKPTERARLFFALAATATAAFGGCELWMMHARTTAEYGTAVRWVHLPIWVLIVSLVGFVRTYLHAGRPWLGWTVCGLRTVGLIANFLSDPNLSYREITALRHTTFLGEPIAIGQGVANPWTLIPHLSLVLLVVFATDAAVAVWHRGERRRAVVLGGAIAGFTLAGMAQAVAVVWGLVQMPLAATPCFLGIVAAMAFEINREVLQAARLSEELRESEARFRNVADTAPVMIWMSGPDKLCNFFNKGWLAFTGRALEKELGNGWAESVHPNDLAACMTTYSEAFDARRPLTMEYRLRRHDGEYRLVSNVGVPRFDSERNFLGYIGSCVDLTEHKRADEKFRLAVEASPNGIVLANAEGRIVLVNVETERLFGYTRQELLGRAVEMLLPDRYRAAHPGHRAGFLSAPRPRAMGAGRELFALRKDGTEFPVEIGLSPLQTEQGTLVLTAIVDITARKQAEEARRESEARLASAVEVAGLGFYEVKSAPGQVFLDERLCSMLGLTPQDNHRVQEFWIENVHPDDRDRVQELSRKVLAGELPGTTVEYRFLHPERGTRWFNHVFRAQAQDATGKVIRRLGVIRDITEQRRAELESQRLRDNLAHLTRVNTLGALSGSLAHELNQPLGIILSNAQAAQELLTQEQPDTPEVQAILADIVAADRRAGEIIDRLRALFKGGQVSLQELSLNTVIEEVLSLLHAELLGRGVTVIRELAPDLPLVAGDRVQLQQLVLNLVLNAADAMAADAQGARQLHLRTMLQLDRVRVSVRDAGEGLPADVERLFQPLYTTKRHGLGMGLAICRSIVASHEGRLWAERHPERGAVFHFELPLAGEEGRGTGGEGRRALR